MHGLDSQKGIARPGQADSLIPMGILQRWLRRWRVRLRWSRRGMAVLFLVMAMGSASTTVAIKFYSDTQDEWAIARLGADGFRARQLALAGFQAGLAALKAVPEQYLFETGLALNPPDLQVSEECPRCFVRYRIQPEDGRLNVNHLVRMADDEPDDSYHKMFQRLFSQYSIPLDAIDALGDWVDKDNVIDGRGAEASYYERLKPPIKIKNGMMFSVSEMGQVKGLDRQVLYTSHAPPDWAKQQEEMRFQSEDEQALIQPEDWIPANNLAAYIPPDGDQGKININAARYHVLMSLSDAMVRQAALEIFKLRRKKKGYIKDLKDLKELPSMQIMTPTGVTLYDELVGKGGEYTGLLKTEGDVYRVTGLGTIAPVREGQGSPVIRKITGLYDKKKKRLIYYAEE